MIEEGNRKAEGFGELLFADSLSGIEKIRIETFPLQAKTAFALSIICITYGMYVLVAFITSPLSFGLRACLRN